MAILGSDGLPTEGDRLINIVWYRNVAAGAGLDRLMTGEDGVRRPMSLPPGMATGETVSELRETAAQVLAPPIAEVVMIFGLYGPGN